MTKKNPRIHREVLCQELADALLNVPFVDAAESSPDGFNSVGRRLIAARDELKAAVKAANLVLAKSPLTGIIAEHAARRINKRGKPVVVVDADGGVMLEVTYSNGKAVEPPPPAPERKPKLPPMAEIRRDAEALGLDWQPYGKAKKKLIAAIKAAKNPALAVVEPEPPKPPKPEPPKPEPPKPPKPKPEPPKPEPVRLDGRKIIHLDEDDDVTDLFRQLDGEIPMQKPEPEPVATPLPPKPRPTPAVKLKPKPKPTPALKTSPPPQKGTPPSKKGGRSLSAIASGADDEIDIDFILAKPAPKTPQED